MMVLSGQPLPSLRLSDLSRNAGSVRMGMGTSRTEFLSRLCMGKNRVRDVLAHVAVGRPEIAHSSLATPNSSHCWPPWSIYESACYKDPASRYAECLLGTLLMSPYSRIIRP